MDLAITLVLWALMGAACFRWGYWTGVKEMQRKLAEAFGDKPKKQ